MNLMKHPKKTAIAAVCAIAFTFAGAAPAAQATHIIGAGSNCTGTGYIANNTAYASLSSQLTTQCRVKAVARCNGAQYVASSWKKMGEQSSKQCPGGLGITGNGWFTALNH